MDELSKNKCNPIIITKNLSLGSKAQHPCFGVKRKSDDEIKTHMCRTNFIKGR